MPDPLAAFVIYGLLTLAALWFTAPDGLAGRPRALLLAGLLLVLLPLGQACQNARLLYPFVQWNMYAAPVPPDHLEYVAVDDTGRAFLYPFRLVAFSSPWALMARFDGLIDRCECTAGDRRVDRALQALADIHRAKTGTAIVRLEAYEQWAAGPAARALAYVWMPPESSDSTEGASREPPVTPGASAQALAGSGGNSPEARP
jgi:hypothetical protein